MTDAPMTCEVCRKQFTVLSEFLEHTHPKPAEVKGLYKVKEQKW